MSVIISFLHTSSTSQNFNRYLSSILVLLVLKLAKYPYLTNLTIQETKGSIVFKNTSEARNLSFANIQQLGKTPQIQEIIREDKNQCFELI